MGGFLMDLYLVRHPETSAPKGTCYGRVDFPLLNPAIETAKQTINDLPNQIPLMIVSPAPRAQALAKELSFLHLEKNSIHPELQIEERVQEMDFGDWDGKLWDSIPKKETLAWMKDFVNQKTPNGEAFTDVIERTNAFLKDWGKEGIKRKEEEEKRKSPIDQLIIVCHSGSIRAILCQLQNLEYKDAFQAKIDFGSVHKVKLEY